MSSKWAWIALILAFSTISARAQNEKWTIQGGTVAGQPILGSEDSRKGWFYSAERERPWSMLNIGQNKGYLNLGAYYMRTTGGGFDNLPIDHINAYGIFATGRYHMTFARGFSTFAEIGWGLQYAEHNSVDLPSLLNSTPILGAGIIVPVTDKYEIQLTARYFHISNAGLVGNNQGQNQIHILAGVRF